MNPKLPNRLLFACIVLTLGNIVFSIYSHNRPQRIINSSALVAPIDSRNRNQLVELKKELAASNAKLAFLEKQLSGTDRLDEAEFPIDEVVYATPTESVAFEFGGAHL